MKENIYETEEKIVDSRIKELLAGSLPRVNENPWFTRRVMNRLPERNRRASLAIWQWVFYALGGAALVAGAVFSGKLFLESGFSFPTLTMLLTISLLVTICGAILTVPSLIRILREP